MKNNHLYALPINIIKLNVRKDGIKIEFKSICLLWAIVFSEESKFSVDEEADHQFLLNNFFL